jgi:hypothetical protein
MSHGVLAGCSGDITVMTVPSLAASRAAARPTPPHTGQVAGDWFLKKGGWRVVGYLHAFPYL